MSPELRDEIDFELALMVRELEESKTTLNSAECGTPSHLEIAALALLLHSFYNGVENMFKRIAGHSGDELPTGPAWHTLLLISMSKPTTNRPAVISEDMSERLQDYLDFRHFFRHTYSHMLRWAPMAPLISALPETFEQLKTEVIDFLQRCKA